MKVTFSTIVHWLGFSKICLFVAFVIPLVFRETHHVSKQVVMYVQ
jgi:branched-subunit amino acid transport protein